MKLLLKLEEAAITILAIFYLTQLQIHLPIWLWVLLFFAPDISMLGYLVNTTLGAWSYNLFHHKGIAIVVIGIGWYLQLTNITATGVLLFAHASFDRIWDYGLKHQDGFKHTHLGKL
jgi:hypothetical protein